MPVLNRGIKNGLSLLHIKEGVVRLDKENDLVLR